VKREKMEIRITPEKVREYRIQLGMTQEGLARELGVSFSTVNRWENEGRGFQKGLTKYALQKFFSEKLAKKEQ